MTPNTPTTPDPAFKQDPNTKRLMGDPSSFVNPHKDPSMPDAKTPGIDPTKDIYCANCQVVQPHAMHFVHSQNELIATCTTCLRFLKFPGDIDMPKLDELIAAHAESNKGHVLADAHEEDMRTKSKHPILDALRGN